MFHRIHEANGGMDRLSVAASRQSAAGCCSHELRRSAETPLRQGSWPQLTSNLWRCSLPMKTILAATLAVVALAGSVPNSAAQEWPRFRGPNGAGISHAKTIPTKITDADTHWKVELPGTGHSSPVLWGDRIFLTSTGDKSGGISALCINTKDGSLVWRRDFPLAPFSRHPFNSYASSTPALDAERVYFVW